MESDNSIDWTTFSPLFLGRLASAASNGHIYPFMPTYLASLGLAPEEVAYYAGLADSLLPAFEGLSSIPAAKISDRYGRRITFIVSVTLTGIFTACVGFNTSVWGILLCRALCGINCVQLVTRTIVMEFATEGNKVRLWSWFVPAYPMGFCLATLIGGVFALPAGRIPVIGDLHLFQTYPFALPSVMTASICFAASIMAYLFTKETRFHSLRPEDQETLIKDDQSRTVGDALAQTGVKPMISMMALLQILDVGFTAIFSLCAATSIEHGGMGLSVPVIGIVLGCAAIGFASLSPLLAPIFLRRFGRQNYLVIFCCPWFIAIACFPLLVSLARFPTFFWPVLLFQMGFRVMGSMNWMLTDLLLSECSEPHLRATTNACAMIGVSIGRAMGPTIFSSVFGLSISYPVGSPARFGPWAAMVFMTALLLLAALRAAGRRASISLPVDDDVNAE